MKEIHNLLNSSNVQRWTRSAIECYEIGCNCNKCYIRKIIESKCMMKKIVIELVRKFGTPERIIENEEICQY